MTCPQCRERFEVEGMGEIVRVPADESPSSAAAPPSSAHAEARAVAREVLDALAARLGDEVAAAARERRLFRDHGRELLEAFDDYRQRAGRQADAVAFREELLRRWRIELFTPAGARG